jgi:Ni/Fe-hydrogenase 1 B-type cytochrome subunit
MEVAVKERIMTQNQEINVKKRLEFSAFYRLQHWVRFFAITFLIISGFYIAYPFLAPEPSGEPVGFLYAMFRSTHIMAGFIMTAVFIGKLYYFLFVKSDRHEIASAKDIFSPKSWLQQIGYYLFISKHPHNSGAYNVVQFVAYIALYIMLFMLIVTGLVLYVHVYHEGLGAFLYEPMRVVEVMLGGLAFTRQLHHILTWGVIIFIFAHVYMAVFNAIYLKEGTMASIFSGFKWTNPPKEES